MTSADPGEDDSSTENYNCDNCGRTVSRPEAIRTKTFADLDPDRWQVLCCPTCGDRLKTVFVGREDGG